ncbi:MAG TPA: polysaccharide biosynthesis tyrosine autokinase [Gemmatimonadaceae bacterium]|nr:polysaccharide biosynthesis tyrosine autokinase [Gemmatimonadaceae bacterium]
MNDTPITPQRILPPTYSPNVEAAADGVDRDSFLASVLEVVALVRRRFWLVLLVTATTVGIGTYLVLQQKPVYRATGVIRLSNLRRTISGGLADDELDKVGAVTDPVLSQIQVLRSRALADEVVQKEGLRLQAGTHTLPPGVIRDVAVSRDAAPRLLHLRFDKAGVRIDELSKLGLVAYGTPIDIGGGTFVVDHRPSIETADLAIVTNDAAVDGFIRNLRATVRDRTDIIDVDYASADPAVSQRVVNSTILSFQALSARTAQQQSVRRREFVEGQLAKADAQLSEAQLALNNFRSHQHLYSPQDKIRGEQTAMSTLDTRRQELASDRDTYVSLLGALSKKSGTSTDNLAAVASSPGLQQNALIGQLFSQLLHLQGVRDSLTTGVWSTPASSPDVRRLDTMIVGTQQKIVSAVQGQITAVDARLAALDDLRQKSDAEMARLPSAEAEEVTLRAQVEAYQRSAERLQDELQHAQLDEAVEAGQVEIVDRAPLPRAPIGASRRTTLIFALILGLMLGSSAAYLLENRRPVIRRREGLSDALHIPTLGLIPQVKHDMPAFYRRRNVDRRQGTGLIPTRHGRPAVTELATLSAAGSSGAEAYRTLRTNLMFSTFAPTTKVLVVTSACPGEGKTTTSTNLAITYAQQGFRVLLVDCDLRRPTVHKVFKVSSQPGVADVILGKATPTEAIRESGVVNLSVLPAGTIPPNPTELLGSEAGRALLESLAKTYNVIIVDTPPLLLASDAAILGSTAGGVLLVVRAGRTERGTAQAAVQQLFAVGARVLGSVLNDPDAEVAKYTSSYYNYYYYNYESARS